MVSPLKVLYFGPFPEVLDAVKIALEAGGLACVLADVSTREAFEGSLQDGSLDLVLLDHDLPEQAALEALSFGRNARPDLPFILLSNTAWGDAAMQLLRAGASDYLIKDRLARLPSACLRALAEAKLRLDGKRNMRRLRKLEEALDETCVLTLTDEKGLILRVNRNFEMISGFSQEEMVGHSHSLVKSGRHSPEFYRNLWETLGRGTVWRGQFCNRAKDGSLFWVDTTIIPMGEEEGSHRQYMSVGNDLSARIRGEEAVLQSHLDRTNFLDALGDVRGVPWHEEADGTIRLGDSAPLILGLDLVSLSMDLNQLEGLLHFDDRAPFQKAITRAREGRLAFFDGRILRSQEVVWTRWTLRAREGRLWGIIQDITEQHDLELQVQHSQRLHSMGTLLGSISHDFNNLLMSILSYAEVLSLRQNLDPEVLAGLKVITRAADRGQALIAKLMTFARKSPLVQEVVDLNDLVKESGALLGHALNAGQFIHLELSPNLPKVPLDPHQMGQVIMNLGLNARDAMPGGGTITFRTGLQDLSPDEARAWGLLAGPHAYLEVQDTGTGMTPDLVAKIFEPFFTTKGPGRGTGLGLSVVHGIVAAHRGHLEVRSIWGEGTCFQVFLPLAGLNLEGKPEEELPGKLLILGDPGVGFSALVDFLERVGYSVSTVTSPLLAQDRIQDLLPDLLVVFAEEAKDGGRIWLTHAVPVGASALPIILLSNHPEALEKPPHLPAMPMFILAPGCSHLDLIQAIQKGLH